MTERTLTDDDVRAICVQLRAAANHTPTLSDADIERISQRVEDRLAARMFERAGKGLLGWLWKLWQPILIALILYGLEVSARAPETVSTIQNLRGGQ